MANENGDNALIDIELRRCEDGDLIAIQNLYADQVLHGSASFEEVPPSVNEMRRRRDELLTQGFPYFVATIGGEFAGYAYVGRYRTRSAYRHTGEISVYVRQNYRAQGVGRRLLAALIESCEAIGLRQLVAIAGDSDNKGSIQLHVSCGFRIVGTLERVGFKHNRWIDTVVMQRSLNPANEDILPPLV